MIERELRGVLERHDYARHLSPIQWRHELETTSGWVEFRWLADDPSLTVVDFARGRWLCRVGGGLLVWVSGWWREKDRAAGEGAWIVVVESLRVR